MTGRALAVDGLVNARDLGGLRRRDGSLTPRGVFFRSENIDQVTDAGWEQLRAAGIRTIVDLRQQAERDRDTARRPDWVTTIHVDLDGLEAREFWKDYWENGLVGTALYFVPHLTTLPERSAAVLAALAEAPEGGVLFHCMGGRDRTGQIAALLLLAAEVEPDDIVDDYLETVRLGDLRAASRNRNNEEDELEQLCRVHGTTTEGAFRSALEGIDLEALYAAASVPESVRLAIASWRGAVEPLAQKRTI